MHVWEDGVINMPASHEGFFNVGLLQRELGGAAAERCYKTAIRLLPNNARYRYSYGNLLYARERLPAAERAYAAALRLIPTHEDALNNFEAFCNYFDAAAASSYRSAKSKDRPVGDRGDAIESDETDVSPTRGE